MDFDFDFDFNFNFNSSFFDDASAAWRLNKIAHKSGAFSYKCFYIHSNGKKCNKPIVLEPYCKRHKWLIENGKTAIKES